MVEMRHGWGERCVVGPGEIEEAGGAEGALWGPDPGRFGRAADSGGGRAPGAEAALLRDAQAGDPAALERLVGWHKRPLFALCYGILGHAEDAEDAVQETFLRALRALPRFRGEATVRTWLFRIALNLCLNRKRDRRHDPAALGQGPGDEAPASVPPAASAETIALRHLQIVEALGTLLPRHRAILLLKEREGWSLAEIGAALGWKPKRVEHELSKARHALAAWRQQTADEGEPE